MLETRIQGLPCQIKVLSCNSYKGSMISSASLDDDRPYTEIEYEVYDRGGYRAKWLERKITEQDNEEIEQLIIEDHNEMAL